MRLSPTCHHFLRALNSAGSLKVHVDGIHSSALHYLCALITLETNRNILLVMRDRSSCLEMQEELSNLLPARGEPEHVASLPSPAISPYAGISLDTRYQVQGIAALARTALDRGIRVLVTQPGQLAAVHVDPEQVGKESRTLSVGDTYERELFINMLVDLGYVRVSTVADPGTFAVRGSLVDLFSPGEPRPVRVDFFGDEIETIAPFHPDTQMSKGKIRTCFVYPATPVVTRKDLFARARSRLLALADEHNLPSAQLAEILDSLRSGELPPDAEALMPVLGGARFPLFDYLDHRKWVIVFADEDAAISALHQMLEVEKTRYKSAIETGHLVLPPNDLFFQPEEVESRLATFTRVNAGPLDRQANLRFSIPMSRPLSGVSVSNSKLADFQGKVPQLISMGYKICVTAAEEADFKRLKGLLTSRGSSPAVFERPLSFEELSASRKPLVHLLPSQLLAGVDSPDLGLFLVTANDLFEKKRVARAAIRSDLAQREELLELNEGDYVVHSDYGIGRFLGVERKKLGAGEFACLKIEYAGADTLYVPVHNSGVIQRYIGTSGGAPKLDRLGSTLWTNRVAKARSSARKLAVDLLKLYAQRRSMQGFSFSPSDDYFHEFESAFPFEETPDQTRAIEDVLYDMEKPQPMDRLVCGDVGFGKTEVAMRASFKAILDGKQVALLVPTTVLAEQHALSFKERFANYPVRITSISRFRSPQEQKQILAGLKNGTVDVVIGTHRLLSSDVHFKSLGLLVVDEEHRFGVNHKEKLKAMRQTVDVLSMTATPIPRTLHMAMSGIRDLSVMKTAPEGRLDIQTQLIHHDPGIIADAIQTELNRGGQVFFLHNRVDDLGTIKAELESWVPGLRVVVAHGQMDEDVLERAMLGFMRHEHDLLLCTTIIESGLDIPLVNTLIVNNAHNFGLAQLYQIRGRVGRSSRQAYAWFIVPPTHQMSTEARMRLATLTKFTAVGSGLRIANVDMELRGVGDILGANQSGHISSVGFDMYVHLLREEVERLKAEEEGLEVEVDCRVEIPVQADIPEEYLPDRHQRLVVYRRIATSQGLAPLDELRLEMQDRFGPIPASTVNLFNVAEIRLRGRALGLAQIEATGMLVRVKLDNAPDSVLMATLSLVKQQPVRLTLTPDRTLTADFTGKGMGDALSRARRLLTMLEEARKKQG